MIQYFRSAMDNILAKRAAIFGKYDALRVQYPALPEKLRDFQVGLMISILKGQGFFIV